MWIFHVGGFLSVVESQADPARLVVRARARDHLLPVVDALGGAIVELPMRDYRFRVNVERRAFADWMRAQVLEVNYHNFKDAATAVIPTRIWSRLLHRIWSLCLEFQGEASAPQGGKAVRS